VANQVQALGPARFTLANKSKGTDKFGRFDKLIQLGDEIDWFNYFANL